MNAGLIITAIAVVLLGVFPGTIVEWAGPAVGSTGGLPVTAVLGK